MMSSLRKLVLFSGSLSVRLTGFTRSSGAAWMHTSSVVSTDRSSGKASTPPDTGVKQKFSSTDVHKSAGQGAPEPGEDFFTRNEKLKRPLSPHLTIYAVPLPMMLSGTHRASGMMLGVGLGLTGLGILVAPQDFGHYVEVIRDMHINEYFIFTVKLTAAWLLSYHYLNGIRHLAWDLGKGFELPTLYKTGYFVLALSVASAVYLAML